MTEQAPAARWGSLFPKYLLVCEGAKNMFWFFFYSLKLHKEDADSFKDEFVTWIVCRSSSWRIKEHQD